jgi:hypothetical protein
LEPSEHINYELGVPFDDELGKVERMGDSQTTKKIQEVNNVIGVDANISQIKLEDVALYISKHTPITCWTRVTFRSFIKVELDEA